MSRTSAARVTAALAMLGLPGCMSYSYLDPLGPGVARTVGNPCPFPYRVPSIAVQGTREDIYISAFNANEYFRRATVFLVVSDDTVFGYQLARSFAQRQKRAHQVSFPEGTAASVVFPGGQVVSGRFTVISDGSTGMRAVILKFPFSDRSVSEFTVSIPPMVIDGRRVSIGKIAFQPGTGTLYAVNC